MYITREEYILARTTNTYSSDLIYRYYLETKSKDKHTLKFDEFINTLHMFMLHTGISSPAIIQRVVEYYDNKYGVCILTNKEGNKILKIY